MCCVLELELKQKWTSILCPTSITLFQYANNDFIVVYVFFKRTTYSHQSQLKLACWPTWRVLGCVSIFDETKCTVHLMWNRNEPIFCVLLLVLLCSNILTMISLWFVYSSRQQPTHINSKWNWTVDQLEGSWVM